MVIKNRMLSATILLSALQVNLLERVIDIDSREWHFPFVKIIKLPYLVSFP